MDAPQQKNSEQQDKATGKKKSYLRYWIAGLSAALLIMAAVVATNKSTADHPAAPSVAEKVTEERKVISNEIRLHTLFSKLQQMDARYGNLISSGGNSADVSLLEQQIATSEKLLSNTIDSVEKESTGYNSWSNVVMIDSLATSFKAAMDNRRYMAALRKTITEKASGLSSSDKTVIRLQQELDRKNTQLLGLQEKIKSKSSEFESASVRSGSQSFKSGDKKQLETALHEEETRSEGLIGLNSNLKKDNERLTEELIKFKRSTSSNDAASISAKNRLTQLENEITDLNAELGFAKVDCSLSRADEKKIISNSRQRQELLEDAVKTLKVLSASENSGIKQRAKDKIRELTQIASVVRD